MRPSLPVSAGELLFPFGAELGGLRAAFDVAALYDASLDLAGG